MPKVRPGATLSYILIWLIHHYKPILSGEMGKVIDKRIICTANFRVRFSRFLANCFRSMLYPILGTLGILDHFRHFNLRHLTLNTRYIER